MTTFWLIFHSLYSLSLSVHLLLRRFSPHFMPPLLHRSGIVTTKFAVTSNFSNQIFTQVSQSSVHCSSLSSQAWIIRPDQFFVKPVPKPRNRKISAAAEAKGEIHVPLCSSVQFHIVWSLKNSWDFASEASYIHVFWGILSQVVSKKSEIQGTSP